MSVIDIGGGLALPMWLLFLSIGLCLSLIWIFWRAQWGNYPASEALDLCLWLMVGAALGGRLLHILYEEPAHYWADPMEILRIWQGGFVFYGGLFGALLGGWWWCRRHQQSALLWGDRLAPVVAFAYVIGRVGCFLNGCCYGGRCDLPWGVVFPSHEVWGVALFPRHPTQLYAAFWELGVLGYLLWRERRPLPQGKLFFTWLMLHAVGRLLMEYFRDDPRGPMPLHLSLATWLSVIIIGLAGKKLLSLRC